MTYTDAERHETDARSLLQSSPTLAGRLWTTFLLSVLATLLALGAFERIGEPRVVCDELGQEAGLEVGEDRALVAARDVHVRRDAHDALAVAAADGRVAASLLGPRDRVERDLPAVRPGMIDAPLSCSLTKERT